MSERPVGPNSIGVSLLPEADPGAARGAVAMPPRTALEQAMLEIWRQVLSAGVVGPETGFFELGGDSLLATQIVARVRQVFGVELDLNEMLDNPTPGGLARQVELTLRQGQAPPALPDALPAPPGATRAGPWPLSFTQERMWFIQQLDPLSAAYNIAGAVRLRGPFDLASLNAALSQLVRRHETLRTTFRLVDGEPRQCVAPAEPFLLAVVDLRRQVDLRDGDESTAVGDKLARAFALAEQAAHEPFNLERGPLLRCTAFRLDDEDQVVLLSMHHIISDAWSLGVLGRELLAITTAARQGQPAELPKLPLQFADFAVWQRSALQGQALQGELAYWRQKLAGVARLELPVDHPRPSAQTYRGAIVGAELDPALLGQLRRIGQVAGATLSMTLLAAFQMLLQRYTGQDDIAVGLPIANRRYVAVEGLIGAFVNTLVMRTDLSPAPETGALSFRQLLARVRQSSLEAYAHQDMPFAKLVAELNPERSLSHTPLVQVTFNHINVPFPDSRLDGVESDYVELDRGAAQFDLTLTIIDVPRHHRLIVEYNTELFEPATAARMLRHYTNLLAAIVAQPDQPIAELPLLDSAERQIMLVDWNRTERPYPEASLPQLFEEQAARTPDAPALLLGEACITYAALNRRANRVAHSLRGLGISPGAFVGVCLERCFDQVAALLGVMKTGAAYVALDPAYPADRLQFMLADTQAPLVLTQAGFVAALGDQPTGARLLTMDGDDGPALATRDDNLGLAVPPDAPAYVTYTSGSTGRPKGVLAPHRGAVNRCQWMWDSYPLAPGEVAGYRTSLSFVDAVAEIFTPLLRGAPLLLVPDDVAKDPARLVEALAAGGVTRVGVFPSLLRAMLGLGLDLAARLPRLRLWTASSETLEPALVQAFQAAVPGATLLNLFGSSEDAGDVLCFDCRAPLPGGAPNKLGVVPIGRPIANTEIYLLDRHMQPAPIGVTGEIYAGGAGLALSYLNRPELTTERFVPNPFSPRPGARLYRTGDLGRYLPDGTLLYLGRRDRQVKVRGVRIELDEVLTVLALHPAVAEGAVRLHERGAAAGGADLAAYYVLKPGASLAPAELRRHLAQRLPATMLPAWLVALPALPRLPNGKLNPQALPNPETLGNPRAAGERVAPRTLLEANLARLWAETLGLADDGGDPTIGITDNFFELGGHSLLVASLFARIKTTLGIDLPLTLLFQSPTIADLSAAITQGSQAPARLTSLVPIKPRGTRPPFFCVHPLGGGVGDYAALARHLSAEQPFYGLRAKGLDDDAYQNLSFEALAADYVAEIRALQPSGPYRLGGYSSGGLIAFEMARQLTAAGQAVALVALLDSYAPAAPGQTRWNLEAVSNLLRSMPHWLRDLSRLERQQILSRVRRWRRSARSGGEPVTAEDYFGEAELAQLPPRHRAFVEAHFIAALAYRPQPYAGRVTLFRARAQALSRAADPDKGWRALALGGVDIRDFPGSHHTLLDKPFVGELARVVQEKLEEISER